MPSTWALHGVVDYNFNNILDGKIVKQPEVDFWFPRSGSALDRHVGAVPSRLKGPGSVRFGALGAPRSIQG